MENLKDTKRHKEKNKNQPKFHYLIIENAKMLVFLMDINKIFIEMFDHIIYLVLYYVF